MKIGIDARSIEGARTGVGRILINLLREWQQIATTTYKLQANNLEFFLYFKTLTPEDDFLHRPPFVLKRLTPFLGKESHAIFEHINLPRALKQDQIDLLYAPSYTAPIFCPVPFVLVIHDLSYEVHPEWVPGLDKFFRRFLGKRSAKKAKIIIAVSDFTRREIIKHYKIAPDKVIKIYQPAVSPELLESPKISMSSPSEPYTLFVGSFFNRRHIPELIQALEIINKSELFSLVLVGHDHTFPPQSINNLITEVNNRLGREIVYHYKDVSDQVLTTLYRQANSVSLLSEYEGFGLPLLEGMSLGVPVLIAPNSSLEEVADGAALVTDPKNPDRIAKDLLKLKNESSLRQELINLGKRRAQDFSFENAARETLNFFYKQ